MKPADIIPGQKYGNHNVFGIEFLGVKKYNGSPEDDNFELILVVIAEDNFRFGSAVFAPEYCASGYWDNFYPILG